MTRKDYVAIAEAFKMEKPDGTTESIYQWRYDVQAIARVLKEDNVNFDYDRFYTACDAVF